MHELLVRFIDEYPEYFEGPVDARLLRGDLRPLFEEYAQAMDPEEYAELRRQVEAYREKEKKRLQEEIEVFSRERLREKKRLDEILDELKRFEKQFHKLDRQLEELRQEDTVEAPRPRKAWYNSPYVFLVLDFLGVFFLYVGIILHERLTVSYVVLGILSISMGFFLQQSDPSFARLPDPRVESLKEQLINRKTEVKQISRIKHVTLSNRKRTAQSRIAELNRRIEGNLQLIREYHRE